MILRLLLFSLLSTSFLINTEAAPFRKHTVRNAAARQAVCNDGSPAVYYFRKGSGDGSRNWVIFLAGGGLCYSVESCNARQKDRPDLMTSLDKPDYLRANGLLSDSTFQNPDFHNANQIAIPYCSSDLWSGNRESSASSGGHEFRGFKIVRAVVADFLSAGASPNLSSANNVLLAGTSAGGIGVMVHLDWLSSKLPQASVRGLNDAGWYPDIDLPFAPLRPEGLVDFAVEFWNGKPDASCAAANRNSLYRCYLAAVYPFIKSPLLIQMSQYDQVVLESVGIDYPFDFAEQGIADLVALAIRNSLGPVDAAFSPRTFTHGLLHNKGFFRRKIDGHSLRDVTGNWFFDRNGPRKLMK